MLKNQGLLRLEVIFCKCVHGQNDGNSIVLRRKTGMFLIADVMVRPDHQGSGIGRKMIELINEWFEDLGSDGRCIMINLMATKGNEGFYQRLGYTTRPNETMGAGMVRWINP